VTGPGINPATVQACCAAAYSHDAVAVLLGDSYHPGGLALTRRLADQLRLRPRQRVADVACGPGTTARLLATEYRVSVDGVDLNASTVDAAGVRLHTGDAERIPLPSNAFDALVCECAYCTFPDKQAAAAEFARLLRPGGRLGLTDITITGHLTPELTGLTGWIACIADARPVRTPGCSATRACASFTASPTTRPSSGCSSRSRPGSRCCASPEPTGWPPRSWTGPRSRATST
jgi:arsenite methyltransferase